jgi:hypothetical protein
MTTRFPVYESHDDDVVCFNDDTSLKDQAYVSTGYPDGQFEKECPTCGQHTFYDIKEN